MRDAAHKQGTWCQRRTCVDTVHLHWWKFVSILFTIARSDPHTWRIRTTSSPAAQHALLHADMFSCCITTSGAKFCCTRERIFSIEGTKCLAHTYVPIPGQQNVCLKLLGNSWLFWVSKSKYWTGINRGRVLNISTIASAHYQRLSHENKRVTITPIRLTGVSLLLFCLSLKIPFNQVRTLERSPRSSKALCRTSAERSAHSTNSISSSCELATSGSTDAPKPSTSAHIKSNETTTNSCSISPPCCSFCAPSYTHVNQMSMAVQKVV